MGIDFVLFLDFQRDLSLFPVTSDSINYPLDIIDFIVKHEKGITLGFNYW